MQLQTRHEKVQCWVALLLTAGEFGAALYLIVYEGHILAIYLAITYAMRETSGGHHYHEIVYEMWRKVRDRKPEYADEHEQI